MKLYKLKIPLLFILAFLISSDLAAQQTISGTITDVGGEPLIGVNILETGTTIGTITDIDGNYTLTVSDGSSITLSYTGFETQTIEVNNQKVINTSLSEGSLLDEVVVVGYGTRKKSDLTGSLVSVGSKDFDKQPLTRIDQALQGRTAGVQVNQTSGAQGYINIQFDAKP